MGYGWLHSTAKGTISHHGNTARIVLVTIQSSLKECGH